VKPKQEYTKKEMYLNVLDEEKAIQIMQQKGVTKSSAGLQEDWFYTAGEIILKNGKLENEDAHTESTWATPCIQFETFLGVETIECSKKIVKVYEEPVTKKVKVTNFLSGFVYEYDSYYDRNGQFVIDFPSSCAVKFNKTKKRWEMLTPHLCPDDCPCRTKWQYKKVKK